MDTLILFSVIFGIFKLSQANTMLRCIECEHIGWNMTYSFTGVQNIYQLLQSKYNPACTMQNPRDQNMYNQNQQNQQQTINNQQFGNNFFQNRYEVRETICPVYDADNRCNYVYGIATVYLPSYDARMSLAMHVRNCQKADQDVGTGCYHRDTQYGYHEVKNFFQDKLQFLGRATVERFIGTQCYCNSDLCTPYINSSRTILASGFSLVLSLLAIFVLKLN